MDQTTVKPLAFGWRGVQGWLNEHVLHESGLVQALVCLAALALGIFAARALGRILSSKVQGREQLRLWVSQRLPGFLAPLAMLLALRVVLSVSEAWGWPSVVTGIGLKVAEAWLVIQFFASLLLPHGWTRLVTVLVVGLYALEGAGALDPLVNYLDGMALSFDNERLSLLEVVKAMILLAIMLPLINKLCAFLEAALERMADVKPRVRVLVSKLTKIGLYSVSIISALDLVGINVHMLTVFSGAAGLGIGFGLQKVVSNLVSGVILLLDNSIKPGDVIEVGGVYGWVDSMNARYASMVTRDGKAFLIPNDELVANKVVNWSYTGSSVRVRIPVGVAYATDLKLASELMLKACEGQDRVLTNPKPMVLLREFGDNAVLLELRMWVDHPERGLAKVSSAVQLGIWEAFKARGVEFPFPQRDLHMHSPLRVVVDRPLPGEDPD
ncbi:Mechanosensitive channel MscK [Fundidesulfovibrio magnetotacticus]|uniref:Mechanosensitive channel MscK n=1 Tax=Fundidesulfovibrio magnetotacticus TaxID=2730080 RepID=A0A6V8LTU6_9BACT|nr:mechanosensitive ion channel domain-containing protein [Fundidesulfovibrio magnetotacticus]GFK94011.1 Mechanosensitive channel MscK [Fundidesulfovibrio magnetotacticus]